MFLLVNFYTLKALVLKYMPPKTYTKTSATNIIYDFGIKLKVFCVLFWKI